MPRRYNSKAKKAKANPKYQKRKSIKNQVYIHGRICKVHGNHQGRIKCIDKCYRKKYLYPLLFEFDNVVDYPEQIIKVGDYVKFHIRNNQVFDIVRYPAPKKSTSTTTNYHDFSPRGTPTVTLSVPEDRTTSCRTTIIPSDLCSGKRKNSSPHLTELTEIDKIINDKKFFRSESTMVSSISQVSKRVDYHKHYSAAPASKSLSMFPTNPHNMHAQGNNSHLNANVPFTQSNSKVPMHIQPNYSGINMVPYQQNLLIPETSQLVYPSPAMVSDVSYIADPAICYSSPSVHYMNTQFDPLLGISYTQPSVTMVSPTSSYTILPSSSTSMTQINTSVLTPFAYNPFLAPY
jgi:hypothetical protein